MFFLFLDDKLFYFHAPFSVNVYVPKDRVTNLHQGYGFVEFRSEEDADYVGLLLLLSLATTSVALDFL